MGVGGLSSPPQKLLLPEQHLPGLVVRDRLAQIGQHLNPALHGRARCYGVKPVLEVRVLRPVDALVLPVA